MSKQLAMTPHLYVFNQSPEQRRRIGARGGRAYGRNRRNRLRAPAAKPQEIVLRAVPPVTTPANAIAALDAQFPWLRGAEQRKRDSR